MLVVVVGAETLRGFEAAGGAVSRGVVGTGGALTLGLGIGDELGGLGKALKLGTDFLKNKEKE